MSDPDKAPRTAVISGAGTGIGRATAQKMGERGWSVAVGGRRVPLLQETAELVESAGGRGLGRYLDVTSAESVEEFFSGVEAEFGPVSVVINNAAVGRYGPLSDFEPDEIYAEVVTKLVGSLYMARRGILSMGGSGQGDILFMTSVSTQVAWVHHLPYAASSAGVEHAARILRHELEGTGIRVTNLRCGETAGTDFATRELGKDRHAAAAELWFRRGLLRHGGLMRPENVADCVMTAISLPRGLQYELLTATPMAPTGAMPRTYEEFVQVFDPS